MNKRWVISFVMACIAHGGVLLGFSLALVSPADFGVSIGENCIEVNLVAAPAEVKNEMQEQQKQEIPKENIPDEEFVDKSEIVPEVKPAPSVEKPKLVAKMELEKKVGDGSSITPGQDKTTLRSAGGAITEAKPAYLKNPPPPYPEMARRRGHQGVVLLLVQVTSQGIPAEIKVSKSSGYTMLDEAAVKGVKKWQFQAARMGAIPVDSEVEVPVNFTLR